MGILLERLLGCRHREHGPKELPTWQQVFPATAFPRNAQLSSDVPAMCVHLRLLRFIGLAALPLRKQQILEYLQQFWVDCPWEEVVWVSGQAGLVFGAAGWGVHP